MPVNYPKFTVQDNGEVTCRMGHVVVPGRVMDHIHPELDTPKPKPAPQVRTDNDDDWWQKALEQSMVGLDSRT